MPVENVPLLESELAAALALDALLRCVVTLTKARYGCFTVMCAGKATRIAQLGLEGLGQAEADEVREVTHFALDATDELHVSVAMGNDAADDEPAPLPEAIIALLRRQIPLLRRSAIDALSLAELRRTTTAIVEDALEPCVSMDADGIVTEWNRAAATTFGWSRDEAIGQPASDLIVPPELRARHRQGFANYRETGQSAVVGQRITVPAQRRDGSALLVEMRVSVSYSRRGQPVFHAFLHDVTELEQTRERLSRSENLLREAQQIVALGSYEHDLLTGSVLCSDELFRILGVDKASVESSALSLGELIEHFAPGLATAEYQRAIVEHRPHEFELDVMRPDGEMIHVRRRGYAVYDAAGAPVRVYATIQDITEQRRYEDERRELELRSTEAFDNAPFGMSMMSARSDNYGTYIRVNAAYCKLVGYEQEELIGQSFLVIMPPYEGPCAGLPASKPLVDPVDVMRREVQMSRRDGSCIWVKETLSLMRDSLGEPLYFFTHTEDISKRKEAESKLEHLAYHDALTGALNRRGLALEVKQRFRSTSQSSALMLLDLDHFKYVNDTMGHAQGDKLLRKVAKILRKGCRKGDIIARIGGDEFVVILPDTTEATAMLVADTIRRSIQSSLYLSDESALRATVSIGMVITDALSRHAIETALMSADAALSTAKARGRDRICVARTATHCNEELKAELTWSQRIRNALERDDFRLYAQPIVNLRTGMIERHELLLRMIDSSGTLFMPGDFLPTAERVGLIADLDCWVVRNAIALASSLQRAGQVVAFEVNLSGASLTNESVIACIERELQSTELDPRSLTFEITETAAIGKMDLACSFAEKISNFGCAFALDDFGAGFSSFYYLKYLPFDFLKLDGEFIRNLCTNTADQFIVKAIVELARGLGKRTIAEFVGDAETAGLLQEYGVDFAQGYFIGKPVPWDAQTFISTAQACEAGRGVTA